MLRKNHDKFLHTSSDGQKYNIAVDSLNSNYSFKYFGKDKGVTVYSFIDDSCRLFYSTVFSSEIREAAYVIDGLLHNETVNSNIHSTDTHGYTEAIFGATYLLGIAFAPRIKNIKDSVIFGFKEFSENKDSDYKVLPAKYINEKIAEENWDDVLRLMVTIKLKKTTASQIFRRLNSHTKQHPLYAALKEFGRIIKSIFILTYYDDLELRQRIEMQLNRVELSHKLSKAVFFGESQEFQYETKEEQEVVAGCKQLIQNALILWNYLYLSLMISGIKEEQKRIEIIEIIKNGSVISWGHVNLHGTYDFSVKFAEKSRFDVFKALDLKVA